MVQYAIETMSGERSSQGRCDFRVVDERAKACRERGLGLGLGLGTIEVVCVGLVLGAGMEVP